MGPYRTAPAAAPTVRWTTPWKRFVARHLWRRIQCRYCGSVYRYVWGRPDECRRLRGCVYFGGWRGKQVWEKSGTDKRAAEFLQ